MSFTLAHISDTHTSDLSQVKATSLLGKRLLGYLSWRRRRRREHTPRMLEATLAAVRAQRPDAVVVSGDLIHIGLADEMRQVRPWLEALRREVPVLLVPGNHDFYRQDSLRAWRRELAGMDVFGEAASREGDWPRVLTLDGARLVGLNSAYAAPLTRADGRLGEGQLHVLRALLAAPCERPTIVVLHHPAGAEVTARRKALRDAPALARVLEAHPPALVLHGHLHRPIAYRVGSVKCYCAPSASSEHEEYRAGFRLYRVGDGAAVQAELHVADAPAPPCAFRVMTPSGAVEAPEPQAQEREDRELRQQR